MDDKLMYIPNNDKQIYICTIELLLEEFGHG